jgi:hypothetical protein
MNDKKKQVGTAGIHCNLQQTYETQVLARK